MTAAEQGALEPEVARLYEKAERIYPREVDGRFARLRVACVAVLLGGYYLLPWLEWGGRQLILFDLPARKFYLFGLVFWPQDFIFLTGLLILAALSLFFVTALGGRWWCGYACPQTIWTETFLWLERLAEGPALKRKKRDAASWTFEKFWRKAFKQTLWIGFALWTGLTFVGYFSPIRELVPALFTFRVGFWESFWVLFYGFATYGNAGYLREQVCQHMCPYARFQGAMFDPNTLIVSYDRQRGEPRGPRSRKLDRNETPLGDCINCTMCVQVCPTGIDIREGLQYECIACAACVDACDSIMDKMNYPAGLIRYTTQNALHGEPTRIVRPRLILYGSIIVLLGAALVWGIADRPLVMLDAMRDRQALYRLVSPRLVENSYTLRLMNRSQQPMAFDIEVAGLDQIALQAPAMARAGAGQVVSLPITVVAPRAVAGGGHDIQIIARPQADGNASTAESGRARLLPVTTRARFLGPME